jgi:hypothetical protein
MRMERVNPLSRSADRSSSRPTQALSDNMHDPLRGSLVGLARCQEGRSPRSCGSENRYRAAGFGGEKASASVEESRKSIVDEKLVQKIRADFEAEV